MVTRYQNMITFFEFYQMREGRAAFQASIENIELTPTYYGFKYPFTVGKDNLVAKFTGPSKNLQHKFFDGEVKSRKIENIWRIDLVGPKNYQLTGNSNNPTAVYNTLMIASRKMIEKVNPNALEFVGASDDQDVIYYSFYKKYLSKQYTHIGTLYVRNDIVQSWNLDPETGESLDRIQKNWASYIDNRKIDRRKQRDLRRAATLSEPRLIPDGKPKRIPAWN